jgi:hypothetical protein
VWTGLRLGRRCRLTAWHWARTFLAGHDYAGWSSTTWIGRTACRRSTVTHSCAQESQQRRTVPGCAPARRTVGAPHDSQCVRGRGAMRTRPTGLGAGNASTFIAPTLINSVTTTQSQSGNRSGQLHDISSSISADRRAMNWQHTRIDRLRHVAVEAGVSGPLPVPVAAKAGNGKLASPQALRPRRKSENPIAQNAVAPDVGGCHRRRRPAHPADGTCRSSRCRIRQRRRC